MQQDLDQLQTVLQEKYGITISLEELQNVVDYYSMFIADLLRSEHDDV